MRGSAVLLLALAGAAWALPGRPVRLELRTGARLLGMVLEEECSDEILVIRELPSRAKRRIPWNEIDPEQAHRLRVELGLEVDESAAGALEIAGTRIVTRSGNIFEGVLLNAERAKRDGRYELKTADGIMKIPTGDVRSVTAIRLSALEVYTPKELFDRRKAEMEPIDTAEKHFLLAEYARAVGALEEALAHYQAAAALGDPRYSEAKLQRLMDKVKELLRSQEALDELRVIKKNIHYKRFDKARQLVEAFKEKYAGKETLLEELASLEELLVQERKTYYVLRVPKMLRDTVRDLLAKKAKEPELTLRQAQQYAGGEPGAEDSVSHAAIAAVAGKLGLEPREVLEFWQARKRAAIQRAFYRDGTFIVLDNVPDALARAPKPKVQKGGPKPPRPHQRVTPDDWWKSKVKNRKFSELRDWLYAWWAEKSGLCEVLDPKDVVCPVCAGKGYVMQMFQDSRGMISYPDRCMNCHMAGFHRVVRFR